MNRRLLKLAVSAGCLCALLYWTDAASVLDRLSGLDKRWLALALVSVTLATLAMAHRWQIVARSFGIEISYRAALREYYIGQLLNTSVPGGISGDVARAVRVRHAADLTRAAQSVMAERLLGQIAMFGFMFAGFAAALMYPGDADWTAIGAVVLGVLVACCLGALALSATNQAAGRFMSGIFALLRRPAIQGHGLITTLCLVFSFYACARAVGTAIPLSAWATLIPLVFCAMLIPFSIGGWGWRESAAAALFPMIGAPASAGVATGITYGAVLLIAAMPAGLFLIAHGMSETHPARGSPDTL